MKDDDVVAELDRWLSVCGRRAEAETLRRARDEIVALRELANQGIARACDDNEEVFRMAREDARNAALEEAARACEAWERRSEAAEGSSRSYLWEKACRTCARVIRDLKEQQ